MGELRPKLDDADLAVRLFSSSFTFEVPKCRKCKMPVERNAVKSSDGALKGIFHVSSVVFQSRELWSVGRSVGRSFDCLHRDNLCGAFLGSATAFPVSHATLILPMGVFMCLRM